MEMGMDEEGGDGNENGKEIRLFKFYADVGRDSIHRQTRKIRNMDMSGDYIHREQILYQPRAEYIWPWAEPTFVGGTTFVAAGTKAHGVASQVSF